MSDRAAQLRLIELAHESRMRDRLNVGLSTLTFFTEPLTSLGLGLLAQQRPDLKGLFLMRTEVGDEGFEAINDFQGLEELDVSDTRLTQNAVLRINPTLPLRKLKLSHRQVTPQALAHIARMETLKELDCSNPHHDGQPIDDAMGYLGGIRGLEHLNLGGNLIVGPGLLALRPLNQLRFLGLSQTLAPAEALAGLTSLTRLETLLMRNTRLDDDAVAVLSPLTELRHLDVSSTRITDRSIATILGFRKLEALGFEQVRASRQAAEALLTLPHLAALEIWIDGVDGDHWRRLVKSRPGFHLEA